MDGLILVAVFSCLMGISIASVALMCCGIFRTSNADRRSIIIGIDAIIVEIIGNSAVIVASPVIFGFIQY